MDKYEFNIKVERIRKLAGEGDFETAMKIADSIDWRRVRNTNLLTLVAQVYEKNEEFIEAKDILLLAFERAPISKRILYKLADLALKSGDTQEAEAYYREFCDLSQGDPRQHLLRYMILKERNAPIEQLIHALEQYTAEELDEKGLYELAALYAQAGMGEKCVRICDKIMLMFGLGKYVEKAMNLKTQFAPLTQYQMDLIENRDIYEERLRAVEQTFEGNPPSQAAVPQAYEDQGQGYVYPETGQEPAPMLQHDYNQTMQGWPNLTDPYVMQNQMEAEPAPIEEEGAGPRIWSGSAEEEPAEPEQDLWTEPVYGARPEQNAMIREETMVQKEEPVIDRQTDTELLASVRQAEVEKQLAEQMSKISTQEYENHESPMDKTIVLGDIREMKRMAAGRGAESEEKEDETTRPQENVRDKEFSAEPVVKPITKPEEQPVFEQPETEEPEQEPSVMVNHLMIESRTPEKGLSMAIEVLKQIQRETGVKNPVAKISGEKLNARGILTSANKLAGKDLVIQDAGDLSPEMIRELEVLMTEDTSGMRVILIDNPKQMEQLHFHYPDLASKFECIGCKEETIAEQPVFAAQKKQEPVSAAPVFKEPEPVVHEVKKERVSMIRQSAPVIREDEQVRVSSVSSQSESGYEEETEMDIDEFAQYACQYASEIDCSITGKSMLALYERIEIMEEDGIPLVKATAEELIEEAADRAERPSFGKLITGVFSSKYDKDGLLILKEEHFI